MYRFKFSRYFWLVISSIMIVSSILESKRDDNSLSRTLTHVFKIFVDVILLPLLVILYILKLLNYLFYKTCCVSDLQSRRVPDTRFAWPRQFRFAGTWCPLPARAIRRRLLKM
jgi:hypothetical protein